MKYLGLDVHESTNNEGDTYIISVPVYELEVDDIPTEESMAEISIQRADTAPIIRADRYEIFIRACETGDLRPIVSRTVTAPVSKLIIDNLVQSMRDPEIP